MKLIVGLGNPWPEYTHNRHNVGFMVLSHLAKKTNIKLDRSQGKARIGKGRFGSEEVILARPQSFINSSGEAVSKLAMIYGLKPEDIIVIHDDLDLPTGRIRIRQGGRSGGHNGIRSTIERLGNAEFIRIKVGIGRPESDPGSPTDKEQAIIDYVLSDFDKAERELIEESIPRAAEAAEAIVAEGLSAAMNRYNQQNKSSGPSGG